MRRFKSRQSHESILPSPAGRGTGGAPGRMGKRRPPAPCLRRLAVTLLVAAFVRPVGAGTAVIPVDHRLPEEMVAILTPLLEPGEAVVATPSGLVVKAPATRIGEIRQLVGKLDRPLKQLTITVLQSAELTLDELNAGVSVSGRPIRGRAHLYRSFSGSLEGARQQLKTLEGKPAYIVVGEERPVPVIGVYGYPPVVTGGIDYRPLTRGFKVVPRMAGCRVRLTLSPWSRRMHGMGDGGADVRAAGTTVEVEPGRWVELGAVSDDLDAGGAAGWGYDSTTERRRSRIFVRVEVPGGC